MPTIKVPLSKTNKVALVDLDDVQKIVGIRWYIHAQKCGLFYAGTNIKGKTIHMHRLIVGAKKGQYVDHINGDGLDNRRENLRFCTSQQNSCNKKKARGTSKYKGVSYHKQTRKWRAYITYKRERIYLGCYLTQEDAARRYNSAALKYHGEFAKLNEVKINPQGAKHETMATECEAAPVL